MESTHETCHAVLACPSFRTRIGYGLLDVSLHFVWSTGYSRRLGLDMDCLMLAYIFVWSTGYSRRLGLDMDCLMLAYIFVWSTGYSRRLGLDMDCLMLAYIFVWSTGYSRRPFMLSWHDQLFAFKLGLDMDCLTLTSYFNLFRLLQFSHLFIWSFSSRIKQFLIIMQLLKGVWSWDDYKCWHCTFK